MMSRCSPVGLFLYTTAVIGLFTIQGMHISIILNDNYYFEEWLQLIESNQNYLYGIIMSLMYLFVFTVVSWNVQYLFIMLFKTV